MSDLLNAIRITAPIDIVFGFALAWCFTFKNFFLFALVGYFVNTFLFNYILRYFSAYLFGTSCFVFRPLGYPEGKCGVFQKSPSEINPMCRTVSFPSLHGQAMGFLLIFTALYLPNAGYSVLEILASIVILLFYTFFIMILQYTSSCETGLQISIGFIIGALFAVGWFYLYLPFENSINDKTF